MEQISRKENSEISADLYNKMFNDSVNNKHCWYFHAQRLKRSVDILNQHVQTDLNNRNKAKIGDNIDIEIDNIIRMLMGFALENLLKGIYAIKNTIAVNNKIQKTNINHNILDLYKNLEITLTQTEFDLVEKLEQFIIWAGRYPTPMNSQDFKPKKLPNGGFEPLYTSSSADYSVFCGLYRNLEEIIEKR